MIILLLLLLSLGQIAADSIEPPEAKIEWATCGVDSKCYCLNPNDLKMIQVTTKICGSDTGFKVKFLSETVAMVQLQVNVVKAQITYADDKEAKLTLYLQKVPGAELKLVDCSGAKKKIKLEAHETDMDNNDIKLFEERSNFGKEILYCTFTIGVGYDYLRYLEKNHKNHVENDNVRLRYTQVGAMTKAYDMGDKVYALVDKTRVTCDPYAFKELATFADHIVKSVKDRDNEILNCKGHGDSFKMRYGKSTEDGIRIEQLECKQNITDSIYYYYAKLEGVPEPVFIEDIESYYVFCAAPLSETCMNPFPPKDANCPNCPEYSPGKPGVEAKVTCEGAKWLINDEYYVLNGDEPKCKEKTGQSNTARFFTRYPSTYQGSFNEDESGAERCFTDYECRKASKLDYPGGCQAESSCDIDFSNGTMTCREKDTWLQVVDHKLNRTINPKSVRCDKTTGRWKDETDAVLNDKAQVRCVKAEAQAEMTEGIPLPVLFGAIGGLIGGGIALSLAILGGMFCYYRAKANQENNVKNGVWKSMDAKERLEHAKMVFGQAAQSTMDSKGRIFHGLRLLSVLLETETPDPAIWDEAYAFLVRIQWTLEKTDYAVGHMLARYLYLEAAKIIDKHSWLAPTPIMSRTDKGLMRAVAVRFLSIALYSAHSAKDVKRLLERGFRQLGFNCVEQYPHCGLLWSVMVNCRVFRRTADKTVSFDRRALVKNLEKAQQLSEFDLPKEREIPEFDTPIAQAYEAIGASPNTNALYSNRDNIVTAENSAIYGMKYLAGMGLSLYRNPSHIILNVFKLWKSPNETYIDILYSMADMEKWMPLFDNIMKLMVHYGRPLDAKKFQTRFTPKVPQPSDLYNQLTIDQTFFEEAVVAQVEELRGWLAERTDLKELKKKPSYNIDPTLDKRLNMGAIEAADQMEAKAGAAVAPVNPDATLENGGDLSSSSNAATPGETAPLLLPEADALDPDDKPAPAAAPAAAAASAKPATPAPAAPAPSLKSAKK